MTNREKFIKCAKEAGIKIGSNSITKVTNYGQVSDFFRKLRENKVKLGMDMRRLSCSGSVEIEATEINHISFIEKDNGCRDCFKFKSVLFLWGDLDDPESSPEMFFEAAADVEWLKKYKDEGFSYPSIENDLTYMGIELLDDSKIIYNKEKINKYLNLEEKAYYNQHIIVPKFQRVIRNVNKGMVAYVNVQECKVRHKGASILYRIQNEDSETVLKSFAKYYNVI